MFTTRLINILLSTHFRERGKASILRLAGWLAIWLLESTLTRLELEKQKALPDKPFKIRNRSFTAPTCGSLCKWKNFYNISVLLITFCTSGSRQFKPLRYTFQCLHYTYFCKNFNGLFRSHGSPYSLWQALQQQRGPSLARLLDVTGQ